MGRWGQGKVVPSSGSYQQPMLGGTSKGCLLCSTESTGVKHAWVSEKGEEGSFPGVCVEG